MSIRGRLDAERILGDDGRMADARSTTAPVTVITVVRNGARTIEATVESVLAQSYRPLEYIVLDGCSTDGTLDILRRYGDRVRWTSMPDGGLYDAMNQGIARVPEPGTYIHFLNADDRFAANDSLERALADSAGADFVYGRLERRDDALRYSDVVGQPVDRRALLYGTRIAHQAILCKRSVFDRVGGFRTEYRIAADYDWLLRVFEDQGITTRFVPVVIASMGFGGVSWERFPALARERFRIVRGHYAFTDVVRFSVYTVFGDYMRHYLQRALRGIGLLNAARSLKRKLTSRPDAAG
jgi:glycosyltransferase involved in cell wall biosynthesis